MVDHKDVFATAAHDVIQRIFPSVATRFIFHTAGDAQGKPFYDLAVRKGRVEITGNSGVAMCRGAYDYLRQTGAAQATWGGTYLKAPIWPMGSTLQRHVECPYRWVLQDNVCVFGYTTAFYGWTQWQRYLDLMALHGINMQFAPTGGEAVWAEVWRSFGLKQRDLDGFFTGPAFLPWHRMGNVNGHDGPLPASYLKQSIVLQTQILARMHSLGIEPVAPGFAGFVPKRFADVYPQEKVLPMAPWAGFSDPYRTTILHPLSKMYSQIGGRYVKAWRKIFGNARYFLADSFNELEVPVSPDRPQRLEELAQFGRAVYDGIRAGEPNGTWVMQGWLFYNAREFWDKDSVKSLLSRVPNKKMLILDLFAESAPIWRMQDSFYGKPWIASTITTWGGNNQPYGNFEAYRKLSADTLAASDHGNLSGFGISFEGSESNEPQFEMLCDSAWQSQPILLNEFVTHVCVRDRYGSVTTSAVSAWNAFAKTAYNRPFGMHPLHLLQSRPHSLSTQSKGEAEESELFTRGIQSLVENPTRYKSLLYEADVCQFVANRALSEADRMLRDAVLAQDESMNDTSLERERLFVSLATDADRLLASHPLDRLDRWVGMARAWGLTPAERNYYEADAKRQVTVWGGQGLSEYAAKLWSGLVANYYVPRWEKWLIARRNGKPFDVEKWEEQWITTPGTIPTRPFGNPMAAAARLLQRIKSLPTSDFLNELKGTVVGEWKRDEQSTTSKYRDWNLGEITHAPGEILIRFQYTSGAHRLEIDGVQILTGGNVIAADPHHGQTGLEDVGNVYRMKVPFALSGSQLVLRAKVRSDGGADSRGTIFLRWKGDHHALSEKH